MPLYAGSTNVIYYTPRVDGAPVEPDSVDLTITDGNGDEVTIAGVPAWLGTYENPDETLGAYILVIEYDEVPTASIGEEWTLEWVWDYTEDMVTQTLTDRETVAVVAGMTAGPTLTVGTNTYITLDEASAYLDTRLGVSAWDDASDADKARALVSATRSIDALALRGRKYDEEQTLEFPRVFWSGYQANRSIYSEEHERWSPILTGAGYVGDGTVPQRVKDAVCEEAVGLLAAQADGTTERIKMQQQGVTSVRIGDFQETYGRTSVMSGTTGTEKMRSVEAMALMRPYVAGSAPVR